MILQYDADFCGYACEEQRIYIFTNITIDETPGLLFIHFNNTDIYMYYKTQTTLYIDIQK